MFAIAQIFAQNAHAMRLMTRLPAQLTLFLTTGIRQTTPNKPQLQLITFANTMQQNIRCD